MRFTVHGSGSVRGIKIDWDVPVELGDEVRAAMAPHDVGTMHAGILRRGYVVKRITYPRGTLAFRVGEAHEVFLQVPEAPVTEVAPVPEAAPQGPAWTVETDASGERHRIVVDDKRDGERTDVVIAGVVATLSRAVAQRLIDDGHVTLAGQPIKKANQRLRAGDVLEVVIPASPPAPAA